MWIRYYCIGMGVGIGCFSGYCCCVPDKKGAKETEASASAEAEEDPLLEGQEAAEVSKISTI